MDRPLFDEIAWRDPISGRRLEPIVSARTPAGVPMVGALRIEGSSHGYPIVDCVARITLESAERYRSWLEPYALSPPTCRAVAEFQSEQSVSSFGFQWSWNAEMRSEEDLAWRVAQRFHLDNGSFKGKVALDAGAGTGDQSRWMLEQGARVMSVDLSDSIDIVARKLRNCAAWVGIQGDVTALPIGEGQAEIVYCEGVIQHTRDSALAVRELIRVAQPGGIILATHYSQAGRLSSKAQLALVTKVRARLRRVERYKLLLITGNLAALSHIPVFGRVMRGAGFGTFSARMPDFRTTWTNTFDTYGNHTYQRHISPDEFRRYFEVDSAVDFLHVAGTVIACQVR